MRTTLVILMIAAVGCLSCKTAGDRQEQNADRTARNAKAAEAKGGAEKAELTENREAEPKTAVVPATRSDCLNIETGDDVVLRSQTFPIDFKPFEGSCFVTTYNPEYDDPPLESKFAIYTDGKSVFDFPGQFNGVEFGCWVEAVAFQDLNADDLTDIIVVGKCSAKSASYNENMVYRNTGKSFTTSEEANSKLNDLKRTKDIAEFVQKNQQSFFK